MELLKAFQVSASGMATERARMEIVASNIANANATRAEDGSGPYQRRMPVVEAVRFDEMFLGQMSQNSTQETVVPQVVDVITDKSKGALIYDPVHPDANPDGMVQMPNVNIVQEMVDLMNASRTYEANLNALKSTKDMAMKALEIGRS